MGKWATKSIKDKMVKLYLDGYSCKEASEKFGYSLIVCYNELKRRDIKVRNNSEANIIKSDASASERDEMERLYVENGLNTTELSKMFKLSQSLISAELNRRGVTRPPDLYNRTYKINDNFFTVINNEEKAYWLGFIAADGSILKNRNGINIGLKLGDKNHIEKFLKSVESDISVKTYTKKYNMAYVTVCSKQMKDDLGNMGIVPNKSLILKPPKLKKYERDFWRGCVDGDGGISLRGKYPCIYFCGTYDMVHGFIKFIENNIIVKSRRPRIYEKIYQTSYGGSSAKKVIKILYKNNSISLCRKMALAEEVLNGM